MNDHFEIRQPWKEEWRKETLRLWKESEWVLDFLRSSGGNLKQQWTEEEIEQWRRKLQN